MIVTIDESKSMTCPLSGSITGCQGTYCMAFSKVPGELSFYGPVDSGGNQAFRENKNDYWYCGMVYKSHDEARYHYNNK